MRAFISAITPAVCILFGIVAERYAAEHIREPKPAPVCTCVPVIQCDAGDYLYDVNGKIIGTPQCCIVEQRPAVSGVGGR